MRVEKGSDFVEITDGLSVDHKGCEVWFIESSIDLNALPENLRVQVQKSDTVGFEKLKKALLNWAEDNTFVLVSSKSADHSSGPR